MPRRYIVFDFFSGLHGWTRGFPEGWLIVSIEKNSDLPGSTGPNHIHLNLDITDPQLLRILGSILAAEGRTRPDLIVASPPCQGFSIASCSTHWTPPPERRAKTEVAIIAVELVRHTLNLIHYFAPPFWIIENPRGLLRKMPFMEAMIEDRRTIWLCQYGDTRGKPTDLWSNLWTHHEPRPMCRNFRYNSDGEIQNRHCHHEGARRGAKTGTQGLKGDALRALLPLELSSSICSAVEKELQIA